MRPRALVAALLLLSVLVPAGLAAQKEPVEIKLGNFLQGNSYLKLPEVAKGPYVMGVVDDLLVAPAFDAPRKTTPATENPHVGSSILPLAT